MNDDLIMDLQDESDLCANDGAKDISVLLDRAIAEIKRLRALSGCAEWISVKDRLPDAPGEVIIFINGSWGVGVTCAYFAEGKFSIYDQTTHWRPLPAAPDGGEAKA